MKKLPVLLLSLALLLLPAAALAGLRLYSFPPDEPPQKLVERGFAVPAEECVITLTFAGDCTLGCEPEVKGRSGSFAKTVAREGYAYPFSGLQALFAADDATLVNLEGVLSLDASNRAEKEFTFIGDPAYTEILTLGSVECVTLANNHSRDFGTRGYNDTRTALAAAGIDHVSTGEVLVVEKDGCRIGITASGFGFDEKEEARLAAQMQALREQGCLAIVHVMHMGTEYAPRHSAHQQSAAEAVAALGADLVVGHHPHIAQDAALIGDTPVFYSLGNCCFGGNLNPSVREGLVLTAAFRFSQGSYAGVEWTLYPIRTTGGEVGNDYRPTLTTGEAGRALAEKLAKSTGLALGEYTEETGAWRPVLPTP